MYAFLYIGIMAAAIICNELYPNKYVDNLNLVMVLFYTFIGIFSAITSPNEKRYEEMKDFPADKLAKVKRRFNWIYSVSFANVALTFVLGFWLRGIFLMVAAFGFVAANTSLIKKLEGK
jgi:hypothetical protein